MAIGWLTALKIVPWSDVIEAAPALVSNARKFLNRSQQPPLDERPLAADALNGDAPGARLQARVDQLEAGVARAGEQQQASAALIEKLAQQNAQLVVAVDALRKRWTAALVALVLQALVLGWLAWPAALGR